MHLRAVVAFRSILHRTNRSNSIHTLTEASKRTRPNFRLLKTACGTLTERIGTSLGDTRPLTTATPLESDRQLLEGSLVNLSEQTDGATATAAPLEAGREITDSRPEQQLESVPLATADPLEASSTEPLQVSRNITQPPDDIPEPSDLHEKYYGPVDLSFKSIPPLPPPVSGWPTPWVEREDMIQYLLPLYCRGWGIRFKPNKLKVHANTSKDEGPKAKPLGPPITTAHLVVEYEFDNYQAAADFAARVAAIADTEDHHPKTLTIMNALNPIVSLTVHTDSAKRPLWDQHLRRKIAGITLRDARFAILVETLYSESYGQGRDHQRLVRPLEHRPQWPKFLKTLRRYSLNKTPSLSPSSSSSSSWSPSPNPTPSPQTGLTPLTEVAAEPRTCFACDKCGMNHPSEICPLNEPFSSCPNCGGDHWLAECREPQADQASAVEFSLPHPIDDRWHR